MFVGLLGPICSGKSTFAKILKMIYKFKVINLIDLFEKRSEISIEEYIVKHNSESKDDPISPIKKTKSLPAKESKDKDEEEKEEKLFCRDYYLNESVREEVNKVIEAAIEVMKEDWRNNYVIYPIPSMEQVASISTRHTFIMYEIEAPIVSRFKRFKEKYQAEKIDFEEFAKIDDSIKFETDYFSCKDEESEGKVKKCFKNSNSIEDLLCKILKYDFKNYEIIRPNWDHYFMRIAHVASSRSNCMKRSVGAVIVNPDNQIVATGYNGTTFGFPNCYDGGCERCNNPEVRQGEQLDLCVCIHAEENAILLAGRVQTKGCSIYVTAYPCGLCAKFILQSGIKKIFYDHDYKSDIAKKLFEKCGLTVKRIQPFLSSSSS